MRLLAGFLAIFGRRIDAEGCRILRRQIARGAALNGGRGDADFQGPDGAEYYNQTGRRGTRPGYFKRERAGLAGNRPDVAAWPR